MRILSLLFTVVTLLNLAPRVHADEVDTWFLGLDELMSLSEADRADYLTEMRDILIGFELSANASLPGVRDHAFNFFGLVPEAYAARGEPNAPPTLKCDGKEDWMRLDGTEFCISKDSDPEKTKTDCPKGYLNVSHAGINPAKATQNGWMCYSKFKDRYTDQMLKPNAPPKRVDPPKTFAAGGDAAQPPAGEAPAGKTARDVTPKAEAPKAGTPKAETPNAGARDAKPEGKAAQCRPKTPKCGDDREAVRAEFFKNKRACVYGGNVSHYRGSRPLKFGCEPSNVATLGTHNYKCPSGVACNPLVFCVPDIKGNKAYCARRGMEATTECDRVAPGGKKGADCLAKLIADTSIVSKETWNNFLSDLKKVCQTDEASAKFHCRECGIMYRRIFALNTEKLGPLCAREKGARGTGKRRGGGEESTPGTSGAER